MTAICQALDAPDFYLNYRPSVEPKGKTNVCDYKLSDAKEKYQKGKAYKLLLVLLLSY